MKQAFSPGEIVAAPIGFREYDARWLYPEQINLHGMHALGLSLDTRIFENGVAPKIAVGHDYRSYSEEIKKALITGLMESGCAVYDIGLALSPTAYFAQFDLDCPSVAMVTASHNENGWTGVKMGMERPLTFGPDEMNRLKEIVLVRSWKTRAGGSYHPVDSMKARYLTDVAKDGPVKRRLKIVACAGNGTAGASAPAALRAVGCEVIELDCGRR
ncbi:MAG: hypothetical protein ACT4OY_08760 [Alphaproteobacteria bacterium]